jgi:hypothetical protein
VREQIAVKTKRSERTVREFFSFLENSGYVSGDQKKPKTYTLLYDIKEIEDKLIGISAKFKSADILMDKMTKEGQEWFRTRLEIQVPVDRVAVGSETGHEAQEEQKQTIQDTQGILEKPELLLPTAGKKISNPSLALKQAVFSERGLEYRLNGKSPIFADNSGKPIVEEKEGSKVEYHYPSGHMETFYQCHYCKAKEKQSFFATVADLKLHVSRLHSGYPDYVR